MEKENLDSIIKIKLLEAQLSGSPDNILEHFMPELKKKDDRIVELEQKLEDKELEAQRKTSQHQNILNNLRTKYEEKMQQLHYKKQEYNSLLEVASENNEKEKEKDKKKEENIEKVKELNRNKLDLELKSNDLERKISTLASENIELPSNESTEKKIEESKNEIK